MWPQLIYLVLLSLGLGMSIAKHGEPREPWHAGVQLLSCVLTLAILYWGGFFDCFGPAYWRHLYLIGH